MNTHTIQVMTEHEFDLYEMHSINQKCIEAFEYLDKINIEIEAMKENGHSMELEREYYDRLDKLIEEAFMIEFELEDIIGM